MPKVLDSRLKGNYGAALVMTRLSSECLVGPVTADTDTGVDLYCETVSDSQPFLHFWVQVKAGSQCRLDDAEQRASCRFDRDDLLYWSRQPVPVFAALVPAAWPPRHEPDIYIADTTTFIIFGRCPAGNHSATIPSAYRWAAGDQDAVRSFLSAVVPNTTARLQCAAGVVAASPTLVPSYVRSAPAVPVTRFMPEILDQLRTTAARAVLFAVASGDQRKEAVEFRRLLARIVEQFDDDPHWENFMARALSSHADEDFERAAGLYQRARGSIRRDPSVRDDPSWQATERCVEHLESCALSRRPLTVLESGDQAC